VNRSRFAIGVAFFAVPVVAANGIGVTAPAPFPTIATKLPATSISLAEARVIMDAAIAFARERKLAMAVVVVDSSGNRIASERMDGVSPANLRFAEGKAFAAAMLRQTTGTLSQLATTRPDRFFGMLALHPGKIYFDNGGEPLIADGTLLGAVGVSGLARKQDEPAGRAGIAAWKNMRSSH
jgi:uncharacterized protein GlcG (DUF336 family)